MYMYMYMYLTLHTAAIDGFFVSPGAGCVTSAPITITGFRRLPSTEDLYKSTNVHAQVCMLPQLEVHLSGYTTKKSLPIYTRTVLWNDIETV